jgi:effector-binding domain-containing protein
MTKEYKNIWKKYSKYSAIEMAQYCIIKAATAKSNNKLEIAESLLRAAFSPITNQNKLSNGRIPFDTLKHLKWQATSYKLYKTFCGIELEKVMNEDEYASFKELCGQLSSRDIAKNEPEYLFIFVRQDITPEYQAVQASHVAYKAGSLFKSNPDETYFVLVGVPDELALCEVEILIRKKGYKVACFIEPDLGDEMTAIAMEPIKSHKKAFLKNYKKLVF